MISTIWITINVNHSATSRKEFVSRKDKDKVQNSSNSLMHKFWLQKFNAFIEEGQISVDHSDSRIKCSVNWNAAGVVCLCTSICLEGRCHL